MDIIKIKDTGETAVILHKEKQKYWRNQASNIVEEYCTLNTALVVDPEDKMRYIAIIDDQFTKIGEIND